MQVVVERDSSDSDISLAGLSRIRTLRRRPNHRLPNRRPPNSHRLSPLLPPNRRRLNHLLRPNRLPRLNRRRRRRHHIRNPLTRSRHRSLLLPVDGRKREKRHGDEKKNASVPKSCVRNEKKRSVQPKQRQRKKSGSRRERERKISVNVKLGNE